MEEIECQLSLLPRHDIAACSLKHSKLIVVHDMDEAVDLVNAYAPEHLIIQANEVHKRVEKPKVEEVKEIEVTDFGF